MIKTKTTNSSPFSCSSGLCLGYLGLSSCQMYTHESLEGSLRWLALALASAHPVSLAPVICQLPFMWLRHGLVPAVGDCIGGGWVLTNNLSFLLRVDWVTELCRSTKGTWGRLSACLRGIDKWIPRENRLKVIYLVTSIEGPVCHLVSSPLSYHHCSGWGLSGMVWLVSPLAMKTNTLSSIPTTYRKAEGENRF